MVLEIPYFQTFSSNVILAVPSRFGANLGKKEYVSKIKQRKING